MIEKITQLRVLTLAVGCGVMRQFTIISMLVPILFVTIACAPPHEGQESQSPEWGEKGYLILPSIIDTPSIAEIKDLRDDLCILSELSADEDYYCVRVGVDLPDRFDPWFVLKVTRDGAIFREVTDPETLELEWVPDKGASK